MRFHDFPIVSIWASSTKQKIAEFLLTHEASMSEREIASILKMSHMTVNRALRELAEWNLIHFITVGRAHLWHVNRKSYTYKVISAFVQKKVVRTDPFDDLKSTILKLVPLKIIRQIILFGSVAKDLEKTDSDIDLCIIVKTARDKKTLEPYIEKLSHVCFEIYGNRLAPYIASEQEFKKKKSALILEIQKGIKVFS